MGVCWLVSSKCDSWCFVVILNVLFSCQTHTNVQARRISIYLLIGDNPAPNYPMVVSVINCHQARVIDLIGLICWLYTKENRQPPIR